jgi:hypothetical protein
MPPEEGTVEQRLWMIGWFDLAGLGVDPAIGLLRRISFENAAT